MRAGNSISKGQFLLALWISCLLTCALPPLHAQPQLGIVRSNGNALILWTNAGTMLQRSPGLTGAWSDLPGTFSPYLGPKTNAAGYFRLREVTEIPVAVNNFGFESDIVSSNGAFVALFPTNWIIYDPGGIINQSANAMGVIRPNFGGEYFPGGTTQGSNAALVYLAGPQTGVVAGLQQTLSATLQASNFYTLRVDVGNIASGTSLPGSSGGAGVFYNLNGFPGYRIELLAGTNVIAADNNTLNGTIPEGQFRTATVTYNSGTSNGLDGQQLGVRLINLKTPGTGSAPNIEVDFDNVRLTRIVVQ